jgi:general secretion pathway protein F
VENVEDKAVAAHLADILRDVREGAPLSRAMALKPDLFSPTAVAMAEAGEANGRLGEALTRLAGALEQEAELRRLVVSSMIYPIALIVIAVGVVLLMLLFVVPQFERMFTSTAQKLPTATLVVMTASQMVRQYGLVMLLALGGAIIAGAFALRQPAIRLARDRIALRMPQLGELIRRIETARFARTLGALIEGEVGLPAALALSQRTLSNQVLASAIGKVADGVKEGGGLTAPLAASGVLPRLAIGFLRTGEETSQLGMMLTRLADVLDRDVRTRLERLIGILTPAITVLLGVTVAAIIASIMSAILGFNDLALSS